MVTWGGIVSNITALETRCRCIHLKLDKDIVQTTNKGWWLADTKIILRPGKNIGVITKGEEESISRTALDIAESEGSWLRKEKSIMNAYTGDDD